MIALQRHALDQREDRAARREREILGGLRRKKEAPRRAPS